MRMNRNAVNAEAMRLRRLVIVVAGGFLAGFVGQALGWYQAGQPAGFIASVIGAIVLLFIVAKVKPPST